VRHHGEGEDINMEYKNSYSREKLFARTSQAISQKAHESDEWEEIEAGERERERERESDRSSIDFIDPNGWHRSQLVSISQNEYSPFFFFSFPFPLFTVFSPCSLSLSDVFSSSPQCENEHTLQRKEGKV